LSVDKIGSSVLTIPFRKKITGDEVVINLQNVSQFYRLTKEEDGNLSQG
jgi:hypothetical protein